MLDSKRPETRAVLADAPRMVDHLDAASVAHGERVQAGLRAARHRRSRSTRRSSAASTTTRTRSSSSRASALENAQSTILGGGRYDGLIEQLGGPPTPGIGFGSGIERVLLSCDAEGVFAAPESTVDCFVVDTTGGEVATALCPVLRDAGVATDRAFDGRSMKSQMKAASKSGARVAVIVGEDEKAAGTVTIRDLAAGEQSTVDLETAVDHIRKVLDT